MKIRDILVFLETMAPPSLQESYDNAGLIVGDTDMECSGILCSLDATEDVVKEAMEKKCNLVVAHHPIVFGGLKKINGKNYVEKAVISAIKNDIALFAVHTNLDNIAGGVNGRMARLLDLQKTFLLSPRDQTLKKLFTFVPVEQAGAVRDAMFAAGAGHIGDYSECSFNVEGTGTFRAGADTNPYVGEKGKRHEEKEIKIEVIVPSYAEEPVLRALKAAHPYEEVAYDMVLLTNRHASIGSGMMGELPKPVDERDFLARLKALFGTPVIRHTSFINRHIHKVALCGGAGSFLISKALSAGADAYITADIKYHEFFDANDKMLLCDIGHFESEQFTIDLLQENLQQKFPTFAVLKTGVKTNPVHYY